jgi:glycosyltransferase involved in cell wall biosynthesis
MEKRLNFSLPNAGVFFNPLIVSTSTKVQFPDFNGGFKLAMPASMVQVQKGQDLALEVFKMKKWRNRPIFLNFYGDGPDEDMFRTMAKDYKLKNVKFNGHINDFLKVWEENHALFLCSYMEGLPLVTVSAMICERLPIVTDVGAHREVIDDNISGFISSKPDVAAIDEALERAWQSRDRWEEIGREARKKILSVLPEDPIDDFIRKILSLTSKD